MRYYIYSDKIKKKRVSNIFEPRRQQLIEMRTKKWWTISFRRKNFLQFLCEKLQRTKKATIDRDKDKKMVNYFFRLRAYPVALRNHWILPNIFGEWYFWVSRLNRFANHILINSLPIHPPFYSNKEIEADQEQSQEILFTSLSQNKRHKLFVWWNWLFFGR